MKLVATLQRIASILKQKADKDVVDSLKQNAITKTDGNTNVLLANGTSVPQSTFAASGTLDPASEKAINDKMQAYVQSRGQGLVTNGFGLLGNNYNFSAAQFVTDDVYSGGGSFKETRINATLFSDESIPINPEQIYEFSFAAKTHIKNGDSRAYGFITCEDIDKYQILPYHVTYVAFRVTEAVNKNATVINIHPDDVAAVKAWHDKFKINASIYYLSNAIYTNNKGYTYPEATYTRRNLHSNLVRVDATQLDGNTLTLPAPLNLLNDTIQPGQKLSICMSDSTYVYTASSLINLKLPETWTVYKKRFLAKTVIRPGTAFVRIGWLLNRNSSPGNTCLVGAIQFKEVDTL